MTAAVMSNNSHQPGAMKRRSPGLSIDMSDLPPLIKPSPPTNTLLITNLESKEIFQANVLDSIQTAINAQALIHSFSPLKSFRRIIVSFYSVEDATKVRQLLDGETVLGNRVRVYFGQTTPIAPAADRHLQAPQSRKLFFISPPPSPPMGWEMRDEQPPNQEVHAEDLAIALSKLHARPDADEALNEDGNSPHRQRAGSMTLVYHPEDHGLSPDLPAIAVEDTSVSPGDLTPMEGVEKKFLHTARPPVELMGQQ